jgi:predicted DNA-binding protein (UPF0251 family)
LVVSVDELEALRLADVAGLYHEQAADQMGISRRTFGRIIDSAHKKVAAALIQGMALRIEGGVIEMAEQRTFRCVDCEHAWQLPFGTGRPTECPQCHSKNFHRAEEERGHGGRRRRGGRAAETVARLSAQKVVLQSMRWRTLSPTRAEAARRVTDGEVPPSDFVQPCNCCNNEY